MSKSGQLRAGNLHGLWPLGLNCFRRIAFFVCFVSHADWKLFWGPSSLKLRRALFAEQKVVGLAGLEPATPRLSSVCSNQLSYRPLLR